MVNNADIDPLALEILIFSDNCCITSNLSRWSITKGLKPKYDDSTKTFFFRSNLKDPFWKRKLYNDIHFEITANWHVELIFRLTYIHLHDLVKCNPSASKVQLKFKSLHLKVKPRYLALKQELLEVFISSSLNPSPRYPTFPLRKNARNLHRLVPFPDIQTIFLSPTSMEKK